MASQKVKGLSIKLSADTTGIEQALKDTNKALNTTQSELKDVDKLLKLDPKNVNLLTQKQDLLSDAIEKTKTKLQKLQEVQKLAENDKTVDKNSKSYRDLERQIEATKQKLSGLESQTKEVNKALEDGGDSTSTFSDTLKALVTSDLIKSGLNVLKSTISAIGGAIKSAVSGLYNLTKQGVEYNASMETYTLSIKAMLDGNEEATNKLIKSMKQLGSVTGFSNQTLIEGARNLLTADVSADEVTTTLTGLAKAVQYVGGSSDDLSRMITNLQGIKSTAKATSADLKQFKNIGLNVSKMLADASGKTVTQIEEQGVTFEQLAKLFSGIAEPTSEISKVVESLSNSFQTQTSKISSSWEQLLGNLATDTTSALSTDVLPAVNNLLTEMNNAFDEKGFEGIVESFSNGIGEVINTLSDTQTIEKILSGANTMLDAIQEAFNPDDPQGAKNLDALENASQKLFEILAEFLASDLIKDTFIDVGIELGKAVVKGIGQAISDWWYGDGVELEDLMDRYYTNRWNTTTNGTTRSAGFGALQSGGYGNTITLNASFVANGTLDETQALRFADLMTTRINENLGNQI